MACITLPKIGWLLPVCVFDQWESCCLAETGACVLLSGIDDEAIIRLNNFKHKKDKSYGLCLILNGLK